MNPRDLESWPRAPGAILRFRMVVAFWLFRDWREEWTLICALNSAPKENLMFVREPVHNGCIRIRSLFVSRPNTPFLRLTVLELTPEIRSVTCFALGVSLSRHLIPHFKN
jgi:hypothetical protein